MTNQQQLDELESRRQGQELAVAWRKGRAAFVLDTLAAEEPLQAALVATLIYETLARWDPYDSKWPAGFRHALLVRSQGALTPDELAELEREYRRTFGSSPPPPAGERPVDPAQRARLASLHVERIRGALASGRPLVRERPAGASPRFLRLQPARR